MKGGPTYLHFHHNNSEPPSKPYPSTYQQNNSNTHFGLALPFPIVAPHRHLPHPATQTLPIRGPYLPIQLMSTDSVYPQCGHRCQPHPIIHYKRYWNRHISFQFYAKWINPRCTLVRRNARRRPSVCDIIMVGQAYLGRCNVRQESW
jgi:hypothetical protein